MAALVAQAAHAPPAAIPTQEIAFHSTPFFNSLFRIACCNHPAFPNPAQNNFIEWIRPMLPINQRSQPFKGFVDTQTGNTGAYYGQLQNEPIAGIVNPAERAGCLAFCNGVRDVVLNIQQHLHVQFNRWSFDLQVRRANTAAGIQGVNEDYHYDTWGAWTPFGQNQPRYVICVYWQNYHPTSRTLLVGNPGGAGRLMGDVQYVTNDNWPFKVAIVDQQQFRHRPANPLPGYGAQVMTANPGENWRIMLRIHADTHGVPRRQHGGSVLGSLRRKNSASRTRTSKSNYNSSRKSKSYRSYSKTNRTPSNRSHSKSLSSIKIHKETVKLDIKEDESVPKFKASDIVYLTEENKDDPEIVRFYPENKHWLV
jgi:hypothetical protein